MDDRNDHDILISVEVKQDVLIKNFENHLSHHFRYTILAWTLTLGALITLAIALIKVL